LAKDLVGRLRPPVDIRLASASGKAFPSGHATESTTTFLALALLAALVWPRARLPAIALASVLAAGIGWSRVYLGVHWSTDVAAGWLVATAWVAIVFRLAVESSRRSRQPDPDTDGG
jgi:undecaprenyl-diphosphatase